jgi:diaminopimelate epimerase
MHGIGNDFVILDDREAALSDAGLPYLSRVLSDRRRGIGGDGLVVLRPSASCDYAMRMFNPDGSEAEMCGNGIRCLAKLAYERGYCHKEEVTVETRAGALPVALNVQGGIVESVRVWMGRARWLRQEIPAAGPPDETFLQQPVDAVRRRFEVTAVSMGNPHAVVFVEPVADVPLEEWGPALEMAPTFPERANVHFVEVVGPSEIVQRTWERGAGATLACGTGACACVAAGHRLDMLDDSVTVHLPGGDLVVDVGPDYEISLSGPAEETFTGTVSPSLLAQLA